MHRHNCENTEQLRICERGQASACPLFLLYSHDLFGFGFDHLVDFFNIFIGSLLQLIFHHLDLVLRNIGLTQLLEEIVAISADIADCNLGIFAFFLNILCQYLTAFLSQLREYKADHAAVIGGGDTPTL